MHEIGTNVLSFVAFTRNEIGGTHLAQDFIHEILRVESLLGQ